MLEEMPPFPERESSILAKLKKKKPTATAEGGEEKEKEPRTIPQAQVNNGGAEPQPSAPVPLQVGTFFSLLMETRVSA